jgi:hypothetical protein
LEGQTFDLLVSLSSGEREVINIVFDVLLRKPSDCVIFFDEPELHLHPDLSYRLINTLRSIGDRNQLVLCTHSPDIISASLDQSVVFIGPPRSDGGNQAMVAKQDDEANYALRALGQSIGVIALGQRVVLIEGTGPSLDRQTYGSIIRDRFPNLALAPSEGRDLIASFSALNEKVLQRTIWGVDFFMLCDRDAIPPGRDARGIEEESNGRLRLLPRYHLENYFLDAECLAAVFERIEPDEAWLRDPDQVEAVLREEARHSLAFAASLYVSADLRDRVGNAAVLPSRCHDANRDSLKELFRTSVAAEESRIGVILAPDAVVASVEDTWSRLESSLGTDEWRELIPGRPVLQRFAARAHLEYGRVKTGYLQAARDRDDEPFADILKIFEHFSTA